MTQTTDAALVERMKRLVAPKDWPEVEGLLTAQARRIEECANLLAAVVNADPGPKADAAFAAARAWYAVYDALEPTP